MGNELAAQVSRMDAFLDKLIELCTTAGVKILIAILIYIVGKFIIGKLMKMVDKMHSVSRLDDTAKSYIRNIIKAVLYVVLVVAIISELGIPMASVITVLASAGVAVGMALQGSLSNLAGGIMLLVFRPFNVGDYIIAGGEEGTVKSISTFYTVLNTVDNKEVSIPNGTLMNSNVTDKGARKQHISSVRQNQSRRNTAVAKGKCPLCGGNLVLRNGRYGRFYGCSNYPSCKYILK